MLLKDVLVLVLVEHRLCNGRPNEFFPLSPSIFREHI